jgi:septum formation protein
MHLKLVLGSGSPRRKELLAILGLPFEVASSDIEEVRGAHETPEQFVMRMAREKGTTVAGRYEDAIVVGADTIVVLGDEVLGKPGDRLEAADMLRKLSGREHAVLTAVAVVDSGSGRVAEGIDRTRVWFRTLGPKEIDEYVTREHVLDKAGAYAIQGLASAFIPRIEGNYGNVVGLPMPLVVELLARQGIRWTRES